MKDAATAAVLPDTFFGRPIGQMGFRAGTFDGWIVLAHDGDTNKWEVLAFAESEDAAHTIANEHFMGPLHYDPSTKGVVVLRANLSGSGLLTQLPWINEEPS